MSGCSDSCLWLFQVKKLSLHLGGPLEGLYFIQVLWVIVEPFSGLKRRKAPIWLLRFLWCYESVWSVVFAFKCTSFILVIIDDRMIDALGVLFYKLWKDKYKVHPFFCLKFTLDPLRPAGRHHNLVNQIFYLSSRNILFNLFLILAHYIISHVSSCLFWTKTLGQESGSIMTLEKVKLSGGGITYWVLYFLDSFPLSFDQGLLRDAF